MPENRPVVHRFPANPLVRPADVKPSHADMEVLCAFNPGAVLYQNNPLMLVRVAERPIPEKGYVSAAILDENNDLRILRYRLDDPNLVSNDPRAFIYKGEVFVTSISHLRKATSLDGRHFQIADHPTLFPEGPLESYGIEDPRIVFIDGEYLVTYTSVSPAGVTTSLAATQDFETFERRGVIFAPDNKDIAIFPEKIGGRYFTLHRPAVKHLGTMAIWLASSENLLDWGSHRHLISPRRGLWDGERVGAGASPIRTSEGWLELYHAADENVRYCTGGLLLALDEPWRVIGRSRQPFLVPEMPYEREGFMPDIIFQSGLIDKGDGTLDLFYGAADELCAGGTVSIQDILGSLERI